MRLTGNRFLVGGGGSGGRDDVENWETDNDSLDNFSYQFIYHVESG